jgi:hypothetical protein
MFWKKNPKVEPIAIVSNSISPSPRPLIESLRIAANALEKDFIHYKWIHQHSCNCGVVVQAVLGIATTKVQQLFNEATRATQFAYDPKNDDFLTWRGVCQRSCSVTGEPLSNVFKVLKESGLRPEDIVHLEYLNNKAILEISGIKKESKYFTQKTNLILYLKAWVKILEQDYDENGLTDAAVEEAKLLIAAGMQHQKANQSL